MNQVAIQTVQEQKVNDIELVAETEALTSEQEANWIAKAKSGDQSAFEYLYRENVNRIFGLCIRLCAGNEALAMEMTQDAFIRAWEKLSLFRGESRFSTWLHRLTVNLVLGERRKQLRRAEIVNAIPQDEGWVSSSTGQTMDLQAAVSQLPERARNVLILHDIEGYRHREIGEVLGMAVGTSKVQLHRARKLMRKMLNGHE